GKQFSLPMARCMQDIIPLTIFLFLILTARQGCYLITARSTWLTVAISGALLSRLTVVFYMPVPGLICTSLIPGQMISGRARCIWDILTFILILFSLYFIICSLGLIAVSISIHPMV